MNNRIVRIVLVDLIILVLDVIVGIGAKGR